MYRGIGMKKFHGILLATDWDGTLFYDGDVSEENKKAIEYFMDNGGFFTVCSGRHFGYLASQRDKVRPNTYSICLNGAYIADTATGEVLYAKACDDNIFSIIDKLFTDELHSLIYLHAEGDNEGTFYTPQEYAKEILSIKKRRYYKAVLYAKDDESGDKAKELSLKYSYEGYSVVRSFRRGLEILSLENTKGAAIKKLASHLGTQLTVAVGDYENDISMLREADVGYAVENATDEVKKSAAKITVACENSAIAKVIKDIELDILPRFKYQ
jgi:Cof subfamily protein (haloacid dehalogenase superfamily)